MRTRAPTAALDGLAVTWGSPLTTTGFTVVPGADGPGGRVVVAPRVAVVDVSVGTEVVVVGSTLVDGEVGTGPRDRASSPPEQALRASRATTAMVGAQEP
jgi:hypothetical protein